MIPKYRAWDKLNKRFVRISDFVFDEEGGLQEIGTELLDFGYDPSFDFIVLMQSTCLKDKNGVEIYEGDIVSYEDGEYSFNGAVTRDCYCFYIKGIDNYSFDDVADTNNGIASVKVIGNIYENPDRLVR